MYGGAGESAGLVPRTVNELFRSEEIMEFRFDDNL
jgi:hypothetical protein